MRKLAFLAGLALTILPPPSLAQQVTTEASTTDLPLDVVAGVHLGDDERAAMLALGKLGKVDRKTDEKHQILLTAPNIIVKICDNRVVHVSRDMATTFHEFAQFAGAWIKVHGEPKPEIFAIDAARSASDPRGALTVKLSVLRLSWATAPAYFLGYFENDGSKVVEALNVNSKCN
jgi:hypothetical protein